MTADTSRLTKVALGTVSQVAGESSQLTEHEPKREESPKIEANGHIVADKFEVHERQPASDDKQDDGGAITSKDQNQNVDSSKGKKKAALDKKNKKEQSAKKQKLAKKQKDAPPAKNQSKNKSPAKTTFNNTPINAKPRALVEELKLFQNNNLLNQQDPMQQLQKQLNEIIRSDDVGCKPKDARSKLNSTKRPTQENQLHMDSTDLHFNQRNESNSANNFTTASDDSSNENMSTVKKGILWQQQQFDKFHQRLFSRWKKRYFILTTDYLVCFKRSSSKVGRSEMGKFLYKMSLSEIKNVQWEKPKKSDKGAIILHTNRQFNLFLWTKDGLDEWMYLVHESIERHKNRKSTQSNNNHLNNLSNRLNNDQLQKPVCNQVTCEDIYENGPIPKSIEMNGAVVESAMKVAQSSHGIEKNSKRSITEPPPPQQQQQQEPSIANTLSEQRAQQKSSANDRFGDTREQVTVSGASESSPNKSTNPEEVVQSLDTAKGLSERPKPSERRSIKRDMDNSIEREHNQGGENNEEKCDGSISQQQEQPSGKDREQIMIYDPSRYDDGQRSNGTITSSGNHTSESSRSHQPVTGNSRQSSKSQRQSEVRQPNNLSSSCTNTNESTKDASSIKDDSDLVARDEKLLKCDSHSSDEQSSFRGTESNNNFTKENHQSQCNEIDDINSKVPCDIQKRASKNQAATAKDTQDTTKAMSNRPQSNLIRRDDSWQSLVSLTRVGKAQPISSMQATPAMAQRSLYAQHIMPDTNSRDSPHRINIDSTITPIRGPLSRQQSIQLVNQKKFRPLPPIGQHAASFDVPSQHQQQGYNQNKQASNGSPLALQPNQRSTSYQHKLLQLQLLHNSNNVDYIRHNGDGSTNDYQIYGPESTANPYGYYSMRSNLKSAASEFSFIRPSSSSNNTQSSLPNNHQQQTPLALYNQSTRPQPAMRNSLILSDETASNGKFVGGQRDNNNNNIDCCLSPLATNNHHQQLQQQQQQHFLLNHPMTGERLMSHQQLVNGNSQLVSSPEEVANLMQPPTRELPLKPNKKRMPVDAIMAQSGGGHLPKSSSLTSNIICFFRRAFSKRSKKGRSKRRSNLAESCSSSLGAFNDSSFVAIPVVPSAFSTGGKSVDGGPCDQSSGQQKAPHRMVDMMEQLGNKTLVQGEDGNQRQIDMQLQQQQQQQLQRQPFAHNMRSIGPQPGMRDQLQRNPTLNQFGSPLHKSNSISTAIGIADTSNRLAFLYDNEQMIAPGERSPMVSRSAKVMSANLTPIMLQREQQLNGAQNHFLVSPRQHKAGEQLPRPSSIYGQPSMISSPVAMRDDRSSNFGLHRSSMQHYRDRGFNQSAENRRSHMIKMPFLDTTREVAEDIPSPTVESRNYGYEIGHDQTLADNQHHRNQLREGAYVSYRQAVVNPMLQSTTMDAIYDNHPMLDRRKELELASYSHYDNHNKFSMDASNCQNSTLNCQPGSNMMVMRHQIISHEYPQSPVMPIERRSIQQFYTPSRQRSMNSDRSDMTMMMNGMNMKPAAIVAPSTPNHELGNFRRSFDSPMIDRRKATNSMLMQASRSPIVSRRPIDPQYQQSPLVNNQTRLINKADGTQATIIDGSRSNRNHAQPVINIAGAPGINLEPSLAASLLRGTNINAYESTATTSGPTQPGPSKSQTFLVSTRLSKTMTRTQSPSNGNSSASSRASGDENNNSDRSNQSRSFRDQLEDSRVTEMVSKSRKNDRNSKGKIAAKATNHHQIDDSPSSDKTSSGRKNSKSSGSGRSSGSIGSESLVLME